MQNSQYHSLHPEKISLRSKSNADIFRGSEAVFFPQPHPPELPQHPTTHFSGAVENKALIGCFANVLHKVFSHFTPLHFGTLKQIYLHLFRSISAHLIASPYSKRISYLIPLLFPTLQIMVCFIFYCGLFAPLPTLKSKSSDIFQKKKE